MTTNPFDEILKAIGGGQRPAGHLSDDDRIRIQREMLHILAERVQRLEEEVARRGRTIDKLNENNTKIVAQVKSLTARVSDLERRQPGDGMRKVGCLP